MENNANVNSRRSSAPVVTAGVVTTLATLTGVYCLNQRSDDWNIMGWYANYVLPVGAMIVGGLAASGYGLASWLTGVKISRSLLWTVLLLLVSAYFAAQYLEFQSFGFVHRDGSPVGFWEYFDVTARSFAWKQSDNSLGKTLGLWGYAFRLLEIIGFCLGGVVAPLLLQTAPYCESCQVYMRRKALATLPASAKPRKIGKKDTEAQAAFAQETLQQYEQGKKQLEMLNALAQAQNAFAFSDQLKPLAAESKAAEKLPSRFALSLTACSHCRAGYLFSEQVNGQGNEVQRVALEKVPVSAEFVRSMA